ncbi:MAG: hypothetical protein KGD73_09955 [Candidatus Lokiarchaeota archaeon]|nr:hypothetical protein [Candidatus Lokiarchaeota archaeon]
MSDILEEFWIFSKEGEPIVNFFKDPLKGNSFNFRFPELDQSTLVEIKEMIRLNVSNINQKKRETMKFERGIFNIAQCLQNDAVIFYKTDNTHKEKKVLNICKAVSDQFEEIYKFNQIKVWDGDLSIFEKFRKRVSLLFKMSNL